MGSPKSHNLASTFANTSFSKLKVNVDCLTRRHDHPAAITAKIHYKKGTVGGPPLILGLGREETKDGNPKYQRTVQC